MSIKSNQVAFYRAKNLQGSAKIYNEGDSVAFEPNDPDNDKYLSCEVGSDVWVNAYEHNDAYTPQPGVHEELVSGVHNDLTSLNGLSKFQVLAKHFGYALDIKLLTGGKLAGAKAGDYDLGLTPFQVDPVHCKNGDDYTSCPIPKLNPPDSEIVCQVTVRQVHPPQQYIANGSIYFKYNPDTGLISFRKTEGFPANMEIKQDGKTNFIFEILADS